MFTIYEVPTCFRTKQYTTQYMYPRPTRIMYFMQSLCGVFVFRSVRVRMIILYVHRTCKYYCHCIRLVALLPGLPRKSRTYAETCLSQKSYNIRFGFTLRLDTIYVKKKKTKQYGRSVNLRRIYKYIHNTRVRDVIYYYI